MEEKRRKGKLQLSEETHALHFQTKNNLKVKALAFHFYLFFHLYAVFIHHYYNLRYCLAPRKYVLAQALGSLAGASE